MITETQTKLGTFILNVLRLGQGEQTSHEVLAVLKEYKDSSNMIQGVVNGFSSISSTISTTTSVFRRYKPTTCFFEGSLTKTQAKLSTMSFSVLGLEKGDQTSQEVLAVLKEYRESSNMVQGILNVFNTTTCSFKTPSPGQPSIIIIYIVFFVSLVTNFTSSY